MFLIKNKHLHSLNDNISIQEEEQILRRYAFVDNNVNKYPHCHRLQLNRTSMKDMKGIFSKVCNQSDSVRLTVTLYLK